MSAGSRWPDRRGYSHDLAEEIGVKNVFCTVWGMINEMVGRPE